MPRISAAALGVVPAAELEFPPPAHLSEPEKVVFRDVVASADPGHFRHEDRELLGLYCAQVTAARALMKKRRRAAEQERDLRAATALIITLSTKLRLGPKSRAPDNRRAASAGMRRPGPRPWDSPRAKAPEAAREEPRAPGDQRWNST
jgi:phage terminase small subunit